MHVARLAFAGLAWVLVGLIVLQVFWVGMALFAGGGFALHRDFGYLVSGVPLLVLGAAFFARPGSRILGLVAGLFVITFLQTVLPVLRADLPIVAALHPPTALLIFWLSLVVARRATALARMPAVAAEVPPEAVRSA
ncbi:MAG TPA: DUF6220 domain-containing protein [Candidatus Limnocylindrales bacterium]|jgi:hypothetical protein|nr:DUF6220 domain-containing protein [Candidatus Limnocylindrales bacterium]